VNKQSQGLNCAGRIQEASFTFCLTPQQAADIASSKELITNNNGEQKVLYTHQVIFFIKIR